MCGRFTLKASSDDLERIFGHRPPPGHRPRYNIAPMQEVLAVVAEDGAVEARTLRWGLVPFWADDPKIGSRMINARAETVAEKPAFRAAFARRRCLIVADGFYEWQQRDDGKHPMWIRMRDAEPFAFAGVWERWGKGARPIETCAILTTRANDFMGPIHERMPVLLGAAAREAWLAADSDRDALHAVMEGAREVDLAAHEVSTLVNSPAHDMAECIDCVE